MKEGTAIEGIVALKNPIREYTWGSTTALPELLGQRPSQTPMAELWMGAHPSAPSGVLVGREVVPLDAWIARDPESILGKSVSRRFGGRLPFLFKVLAAAEPLSIQAHPGPRQARAGFNREERLGIRPDSPERNYKDPHHKPELLCAYAPFTALCGFRPISHILRRLGVLPSSTLHQELGHLVRNPDPAGLKRFFGRWMGMPHFTRLPIIETALEYAAKHASQESEWQWVLRLHAAYPGDPGVLSPLFLHLVHLEPGQALYLAGGIPHAYLEGTGMELMANSDNVVRGGLTAKHVDVPELLRILAFEPGPVPRVDPVPGARGERVYTCPAREFALSRVRVSRQCCYEKAGARSAEILICVEGSASLVDGGKQRTHPAPRGTCFFIPSCVPSYRLLGEGTFFKAWVPL